VRLAVAVCSLTAAGAGAGSCVLRTTAVDEAPIVLAIGVATPQGEVGEGVPNIVEELSTEGLVRVRDDGRHEALLAESWTVEDGGRRLTFRLRHGVRFHDGTELTAEIVKVSLDASRNDPRQLARYPTLGEIERIDVSGTYVVSIQQQQPSLLLLDEGVRITRLDSQARRLGTGPFVIEGQGQDVTVLRGHAAYYRGRPRIDVIRITTYPTVRTAWAAMMRSEIDLLYEVPLKARDFVARESRVEVFPFDAPYAYALVFNTTRPVFRSPGVRVALNHAVDRAALIERRLQGHGSVASGIWPRHWAYGGTDLVFRHDPQRADSLLLENGFPRPERATSREAEMPSRLRFMCIVPMDLEPLEQIALDVQKQLYNIGVNMKLEALAYADFNERVAAGDYDCALLWWNTGRALPRLYLWHSSQRAGAARPSVTDEALHLLRRAGTEDAVLRATSSFQRSLYEDPPAIFLATRQGARAVRRRFEVPKGPDQDIFPTIWQWRPTTEDRTE
jgi:peptide/nickel transport system substrate-binding protein